MINITRRANLIARHTTSAGVQRDDGRLRSPASTVTEVAPRAVDYANEVRFHDEWGESIDPATVPVVESFEACTAPENRYIMHWLGDVRGLHVLDLGCGAGEAAVYFAMKGANVTAVDISESMLEVTRRVAKRYGVRVATQRQSAELLPIPDKSVDIVYAANLLHHTDMERCLDEVCRVLKPSGRFVSWDPLRHNPIINVYRRIASSVRTKDETPLSIEAVKSFERRFHRVTSQCFWLAGLWIFIEFFAIRRVSPSKERYWKKIILEANSLRSRYIVLEVIDKCVMAICPFLRRWCWNLAVCAEAPR